jgi:integrase
MQSRGNKERSINRIALIFRAFLEHVGDKDSYEADDVRSFLAKKTRDGCTGTTVHNYYRYLKTVFDVLDWEWGLTHKDAPKKSTPQQPHYNLEEQRKLADAATDIVSASGSWGEMLKARNYAMVRLDQVTMLRVGEMRLLDIEDYRPPVIRIRKPEKNSRYTERFLDPKTCEALDDYLRKRGKPRCPALFVTGRRKRESRVSLRRMNGILMEIREEAGIDKERGGWHSFRRGGITIAHKRGMSAKAISKYTGITEDIVNRYIQLDTDDATEMFINSHPFFQQEGEDLGNLVDSEDPRRKAFLRELIKEMDPEEIRELLEK